MSKVATTAARLTSIKMLSSIHDGCTLDSLSLARVYAFETLKPQLQESDMHNLFLFIWAQDTHNYDHPRYRIQAALAILFLFHLGLHPSVALHGGLSYKDTRVLVTKKDNNFRVLLLIYLEDRETSSKSVRRWSGSV